MAKKEFIFVNEYLYWSYANLATAHSALSRGSEEYTRINYIIRARLFKGLKDGRMNIRSIIDDERLKMNLPRICSYCGSNENLSIDHLIPKFRGGRENSDNLVWACKPCNSSKNKFDVMEWYNKKGGFPTILLLRRYLKLIIAYCTKNDLMNAPLKEAETLSLPFSLQDVPQVYPEPSELKLWIAEIQG